MSDLKVSVQRFLHASEKCRLCIEVKTLPYENTKGKKKTRYLSIIGEESKKEYAVLILKKPKKLLGQYQVDNIFPIYKTFKIEVQEENILMMSLPWRHETRKYQVGVKSSLENLLDEMAYITYVTNQNDYDQLKSSHVWIAHYMSSAPGQLEGYGNPLPSASKPIGLSPSEFDDAQMLLPPSLIKGYSSKEEESKDYIKTQMKERMEVYTERWDFIIHVMTWNVNSSITEPGQLKSCLKVMGESPPDIIAIGLQEIDMSPEAMILSDISKGKQWESYLVAEVNSGDSKYIQVECRQLAGMFLIIFTKNIYHEHVKDIRVNCVPVGAFGLIGNKGGVGIRFQLHDTTICFINSHLAAHQDNWPRRNDDFHEIYRGMKFELGNETIEAPDHDILFWMGDLNYRINLSNELVRQKCEEKKYDVLLEHDQLLTQIKSRTAFNDFDEETITFAPTYKYDANKDIYDTSEKRRIPAYCDRILWRKGSPVTPKKYYREEIRSSDHRPVFGTFSAQFRIVNEAKKSELFNELAKGMDKAINELIPDTLVSCNTFIFENVRFGIKYSKSFVLENIGSATAKFQFIPKHQEKYPCKPWLTPFPRQGTLAPGAKVIITLTIYVDSSTAPMLNRGKDKIEDILILSMVHGRHHFISVTGSYLQSCFGMSLLDLVRMPGPVRTTSLPQDTDEEIKGTPLLVPKELWRLVDYLYTNALDEPNLFIASGNALEMENIRECLDTNTEFTSTNQVHSVADVLVKWLDSLPEPVIPFTLYQKCLDSPNAQQLRQIICSIPKVHFHVFVYTLSFIRELLQHRSRNKLPVDILATVFGNVMIRSSFSPTSSRYGESTSKKKASFLIEILKNPAFFSPA